MDSGLFLGTILAATALAYRIAAVETNPVVQLGILAASAIASLVAIVKLYRSLIKPLAERVEAQEHAQRRVENREAVTRWRYNNLVRWLQGEGIPIPDQVAYAEPPRGVLPWPDHPAE